MKKTASLLQDDFILVGRIVKTRGVRGQLKVLPLTDFPERFETLDSLYLDMKGSMERYAILKVGFLRNILFLNLEGCETVEQAAKLVGSEVYIKRSQREEPPEDVFYFDDIEGYRVVSTEGEEIGILKDVYHLPSSDCLVIEHNGEERLIPFVKELALKVDTDSGVITVVNMPSLWEE